MYLSIRMLQLIAMYNFFIFLLMTSLSSVNAQEFAPLGAVWHSELSSGFYYIKVTGDTIINSTPCRRITQTPVRDFAKLNVTPQIYPEPDVYVYNTPDTVFVYNTVFEKFTPMLIFNVNDGDTVTLPITQPQGPGLIFKYEDSTFSFRVDSVRIKQYDTAMLKTVYTTPLSVSGKSIYSWRRPYVQRLGSLNTGMLPDCMMCGAVASDNYQAPGSIRCYADASMSVKLVSGDCAKGIVMSVAQLTEDNITVYPNPVSDKVFIKGLQHSDGNVDVAIADITGRVIIKKVIPATQPAPFVDVALLPAGTYVLQLSTQEQIVKRQKLIIAY